MKRKSQTPPCKGTVAFTLVELLVVIASIGLLAALLIPVTATSIQASSAPNRVPVS